MSGNDVRLVPAALTAWGGTLFLLGTSHWVPVAAVALSLMMAGVTLISVARRRRVPLESVSSSHGSERSHRPPSHRAPVMSAVAAQCVLLGALLACTLVTTGPVRHARADWQVRAERGQTVTTQVAVIADPVEHLDGPEWRRGTASVRVNPRGAPGVTLLLSVPAPGSVSSSSDRKPTPKSSSPPPPAKALSESQGKTTRPEPAHHNDPHDPRTWHRGDQVTLTGRLRASGALLTMKPTRISGYIAADGVRTRLSAAARVATAHLPADVSALVRGMTTGDTQGMSTQREEVIRRSGLTHLVAVSGANIALVIGSVVVPLLILGVPRRPRLAIGAILGAGYICLVSDQPSVLRAGVMVVPLLVARFLGYRARPIPALAATTLLWALADPAVASSLGFILSVLATSAIITAADPLARLMCRLSGERIPRLLALAVTVPLVAQLVCTPLLVLLTPEVSLWSVLANMLVAPFVGPATLCGMLGLVIAPWWPGAAALANTVAAGAARIILVVSDVFGNLPGSALPVPQGWQGSLTVVGVSVGLGMLLVLIWKGRRTPYVRWGLAGLLVAVGTPPMVRMIRDVLDPPAWTIAQCDVGQGDAFVARDGPDNRAVILIDTGPDPASLRTCLNTLKIDHVDLVVLTHAHADHIGGLAALSGGRTPRRTWRCPVDHEPGEHPLAGDGAQLDGLKVRVLWPSDVSSVRRAASQETSQLDQAEPNDCSLTVDVSWPDGRNLLALGDLEPAAQRAFLAQNPSPHAQVVKVAHHGSARQYPQLYRAINAQIALIGVGRGNTFGHPAARTLTMLTENGADILRTDRDGITVVEPAAPGQWTIRRMGSWMRS
ncbi:ComEC/Rec2 family competence protein [Devriesea agamarum]|uniref:ComEC/Rec2 family competence protein n=1 Tax=Devriesea agamarum TaxID=472569 RepID=UPI00071C9D7D|nr:ComEC/Rec2 family competence protein [Devriesea agamarum]